MPIVKCHERAGGEILTVGNESYQENKKASGLKGKKSTVDRTHSTGYFFCPKLEGGFIPQPRQPHFSEDIHRQTDRQTSFVREQQQCWYLNRGLPACFKRIMSSVETGTGRALKYSWWHLHWAGRGGLGTTARTVGMQPPWGCGLWGLRRMAMLLAWGCVFRRRPVGMKIALVADAEKDLRLLDSKLAYLLYYLNSGAF